MSARRRTEGRRRLRVPGAGALLLVVASCGSWASRDAREHGAPPAPERTSARGGTASAPPDGDGSVGARDPAGLASPPAPEREPWAGFARTMLSLVNRDRSRAGVAPLADDPEARAFAADVARRLVAEGFGHVAADGSKPYQRWARRGGAGHVRENLFRQRASGVRAYMLFDPAAAHARFMRSSGHRVTILDPAHTGLGVAVVWDRERNTIYAVEEFVVRRLEADPGLRELTPGEGRVVEGRLLEPGAFRPAGAALHREPAKGSAEARRAARADSYGEGRGEPALALGRAAFAHDAASGEFRLSWTVPARLAPGDYTLFLFLEPVEADARDGERPAPFVAASLTYEVRA